MITNFIIASSNDKTVYIDKQFGGNTCTYYI